MSGRIANYQFKTTLTTVAGTASVNIPALHKESRQLIIIPASSSTVYDIALVDRNNIEVYHPTDCTGEWNDAIRHLITIGNYTLIIRNATADENFTVLFTMREV